MAEAYICFVQTEKFETLSVNEILDDQTRKLLEPERFQALKNCSRSKRIYSGVNYWVRQNELVHRMLIYDLAGKLL